MLIPVESIDGGAAEIMRSPGDDPADVNRGACELAGSWPIPWDGPALSKAIARRRSVREFAPDPIAPELLSSIIGVAREASPVRPPTTLRVDVAIAARSAVFRTTPSGELTSQVGGLEFLEVLHDCYTAAPVLLLIHDSLTTTTERYRATLLAAAGLGHNAWLAALTMGLDGCVFPRSSGLVTSAARESGRHADRHLFTVAIGRSAH